MSSILEALKQNTEIQVLVKLSDDHKKKLTKKGIDFGPKLIKSESKKYEEIIHTTKLSYLGFREKLRKIADDHGVKFKISSTENYFEGSLQVTIRHRKKWLHVVRQ